jgi:Reverse transcriptase (RNA-dependent DNA polymerase)
MFPSNFVFPQERIQEQDESVVENHSEDMSIIQDNEGSEVHESLNQESTRIEEVALRRSNRQTRPPTRLRDYVSQKVIYPIQEFISYNKVSPQYKALLSSIDKQNKLIFFVKANKSSIWRKPMEEELQTLEKNDTWDVVKLPNGKKILWCKWVYKIKYNCNSSIDRYKARLVAKRFTQTYEID